jgi:predicted DNA-binding protein (UPF0251 family)/predicted Fe-Mo cluster-binding NifX family protein
VRPCAFTPTGVKGHERIQVILGFDELEALRLADLEGLYQEAAAIRMGVSRQTFGRIVETARRKVADAIINGKHLRVAGGDVVVRGKEENVMKIAVPARDGQVDAHFGHCDHFMVYTIDASGAIAAEERIDSPKECGCKSGIASELARAGVTRMAAGNMGDGAVRVLKANGIEVARGAVGDARRAAQMLARGELADSMESCTEHAHGCHDGPEVPRAR